MQASQLQQQPRCQVVHCATFTAASNQRQLTATHRLQAVVAPRTYGEPWQRQSSTGTQRGVSIVCFQVPKKQSSRHRLSIRRIHYYRRAWSHAYYALDILAKLQDEEGDDFEEELERSGKDLNKEDDLDDEDELDYDDDDELEDEPKKK